MAKNQLKIPNTQRTLTAPRKRFTYSMPHSQPDMPAVITKSYDAAYKEMKKHYFYDDTLENPLPSMARFKADLQENNEFEIAYNLSVTRK